MHIPFLHSPSNVIVPWQGTEELEVRVLIQARPGQDIRYKFCLLFIYIIVEVVVVMYCSELKLVSGAFH